MCDEPKYVGAISRCLVSRSQCRLLCRRNNFRVKCLLKVNFHLILLQYAIVIQKNLGGIFFRTHQSHQIKDCGRGTNLLTWATTTGSEINNAALSLAPHRNYASQCRLLCLRNNFRVKCLLKVNFHLIRLQYAIVINKYLGGIFFAPSKVIKSKMAAVEFMKCALSLLRI